MRAIVTFHSIDGRNTVLSYAPKLLGRFLDALSSAGMPVCDLDTLLDPKTRQGVALTFDDGMRSVFTDALPILRDHGVPAHLFLATNAVGQDNRWPGQPAAAPHYDMLDWDQIEGLHEAGIRVEGHTASHPDLRALSAEQIRDECLAADAEIERRLGRRPEYFAYPYGFYDQHSSEVAGARYKGCVTTELRSLRPGDDPAALPRLDSYYLKSPIIYSRLDALHTHAYLVLRNALRKLRGAF